MLHKLDPIAMNPVIPLLPSPSSPVSGKGYQEEVDNLTKRAKFGENAFLNIYQKLYEAPDPYPALASIAEQDLKISELESENRKMKVELEEFRTEAMHLKNQQATIRRLEERNRQLEQQVNNALFSLLIIM
ncbi:hypothetical protein V6N12_011843 [Hibiscus sabdariffa]|uniref:Cux N-terminal domain-containing protein n=1 Tax=Hibiscus sabdariffa TaxID=183260 RepID=A0ABR2CGU4_9ROSI